jgi:LacI family transcriptional regulator
VKSKEKRARLRVALFMDASVGYSGSVIRGVARYVELRHDWAFRWILPRAESVREIREWGADAVIASLGNRELAEKVVALRVPSVNVGREEPHLGFMHVSNDDRAIGATAARHLLERRLTRFAYVNGSVDAGDRHREAGFRSTVRSARHEFHTYRREDARGVSALRRAPRRLTNWLKRLPKPVGVLAFNDAVALRVVEACNDGGLGVPDEIAVLGVDNAEAVCLVSDPPLSSVMVAAEQIGYEAARAVEAALRSGRGKRGKLLVPPMGIATRQSTDVFAVADPVLSRALRFIADHAAEGIRVPEIARAAGVDRRSLERRFRAALGRSPFDELRRVEVARARRLLEETDFPLALVAEYSGFSSAKHLSTAFARTGESPRSFRARTRYRRPA